MKFPIKPTCASSISNIFKGNPEYYCTYLSNLDNSDFDTICFYKGNDLKFISDFITGILILKSDMFESIKDYRADCLVFVEDPFRAFAQIVNKYYCETFSDSTKHQSNISSSAYVEENVQIGQNTLVYPNTTIFGFTKIGSNCHILSNTSIGTTAMSYYKESDRYYRMAHLGNVIIEDHVDIGCNTTILRGILENTIIKKGSKIGNQVNVGHSSIIGENTYISAGVTIGGASNIGKNCWIAPGVSIRDHISIGDNTIIGVGSVVVQDAKENSVYYGNPAKFVKTKYEK